jgi:hypothetical protein
MWNPMACFWSGLRGNEYMGELQIAGLPTVAIPHGNLCAEINRSLAGSEIEGGLYLSDLPYGARLELATVHHTYWLVNHGAGRALISGHPQYCPIPVEVLVSGSNWGGSLLKSGFVGRGMRLEFLHPDHDLITTSRVRSIRQLP